MGWIWWWSIHAIGRLIAVFNGARKPQGLFCNNFISNQQFSFSEHVLAMCIDEKCNILFTCKFYNRKFCEKIISKS
jgi:hypothetical protein